MKNLDRETFMNESKETYGENYVNTVARFQPTSFAERLWVRNELDPALAHTWLRYFTGLFSRDQLSIRTRVLVMVGQFTMTKNPERLKEVLVLAIQEKVDLRECLEVILQCFIYGGDPILDKSLSAFYEVVSEHDLLSEIRKVQIPFDGIERNLEDEKKLWHPADLEDPRLEGFLERYGWRGISTGLILRPQHVLNSIGFLDSLDQEFAKLWVESIYESMYSRLILDHKTRLLCMVGDLLAVGEAEQSRHHMRGAIRQGAKPREVLEVVFQSCVMFGHSHMTPKATLDVVKIAEEETGEKLADLPAAWKTA